MTTDESPTHRPLEGESNPSQLSIEDTPIGKVILSRPEVKDATLHWGEERLVLLVTFRGSEIPAGFASDYQMYLETARIVDPRPTWKRIFGVGRRCCLEAKYVRDAASKSND